MSTFPGHATELMEGESRIRAGHCSLFLSSKPRVHCRSLPKAWKKHVRGEIGAEVDIMITLNRSDQQCKNPISSQFHSDSQLLGES